jgi:hypothetical protein
MALAELARDANLPQFETFTKRRGMIDKTPAMTLQMGGGMGFNQAAYEALGEPKAVELLFAPAERIIGVRAIDPEATHAYKVKSPSQKRDAGFLVSGRSFTKNYDIDTSVARRWKAYMDGDVLCVDLNSPYNEVTGPRARKVATEEPEEQDAGLF